MVRRAAASNLGKFAATVEQPHLKTEIISIFDDLTQDDQDSVRLLAVEGCAALGKLLEPQDCVAHILPVIVNFSQMTLIISGLIILLFVSPDRTSPGVFVIWFANQLYELCEAVGPEPTRADLVPAYVRLLRDNEAEVRIAAAGKVTKFCRILSPQLAIQHILPCVKDLSSDSSQHVRSALASVIMGMAPVLGKVFSIRDAAANNLKRLAEEFGPEWAMQHIIPQVVEKTVKPCLVELSEDPDVDVRYFANQALQACDQMMVSS
ncbi:hypothetical protein PR202_ga31008 [Eleusine coracana subsp. coracana]|uniref:Phosphatase PP2A regulatory subunit A/Splicing factor 3B subunit 1-like HEAT repeat domain-containing protein n=1 Tax=Eleusine coracana subsp. coracana TaxID=191504 RepID=A0AAV5DP13_ELECO|nr:hypothetical protein PR202_ga31008 [Eleusine coracana subsp. coracana]